MTYEESWEEMKRWLENGRDYLEQRCTEVSILMNDPYWDLELKRLQGKLDGIKTCLNHMNESEKIYKLKEAE